MRKRLFLIGIVAACVCLLFACSFNMGNEKVELKYHEDDVRKNLQDIADATGLRITLSVAEEKKVETEDDPVVDPDDRHQLVYGATENAFYYKDKEKEYVFDLSRQDGYDRYVRNVGEENWEKTAVAYSETVTEETALEEVKTTTKDFFDCILNHLSFEGGTMNKTSATILGRECEKYYFSMKVFGVGVAYNTFVDVETGAGLGISCDVKAFKQGDQDVAVFECTEFKTEYSIEIPAASEVSRPEEETPAEA